MIELRDVSKTVTSGSEPLTILHPLTLQIPHGQFVAIVGPSGSGKSTLLGLIAGLDAPSSGSVLIDTVDITRLDEDALAKLRGEKIGFVFQFFHLIPSLTAYENVAVPMEIAGVSDVRPRTERLLEEVGLTGRWRTTRRSCSPTSRPATSIARTAGTSWSCCDRSTPREGRRSCWSRTTRSWPGWPTRASCCATDASPRTRSSSDPSTRSGSPRATSRGESL
jgi:predicted ABC-type transport system involved in lysophospholipase L1 biosynthesis ATPase subunit